MPHEEQREKNIRLVTEKALDCFLENGIEKTKISDIAQLSGLTERSVFRYFETKADLVLAASLLYWNRVLERIDRMLREDSPKGSTTGLEDAAKLFVCYSRLYRVDPKGMRFTLDAELTLHSAGRLHEISVPMWWRRRDSNSRPLGCEPNALPAELRPHSANVIITHIFDL